jgi:hypothetical protein
MRPIPNVRVPAAALAVLLAALPLSPLRAQAATAAGCDSTRWREDCSTPGVQLALVEQQRWKVRRDIVVGYGLTARGVPGGRVYALWVKPTAVKPYALMTGFAPDSSGAVICADSVALANLPRTAAALGWCKRGLGGVGLSAGQFARGEAYRVALISTDDSVFAYAAAIPHPLEASASGCTVTGEMHSRELFAFSGTGFRPGETVQVSMRSGSEAIAASQDADQGGRLAVRLVLPAVKGKAGGDATYEVAGAGCKVILRYGWGNKVLGPET